MINKSPILLIVICTFYFNSLAQNAAQGEKAFKSVCAACHTIGKGKIVGPDLSGVGTRRTEKWLISFIRSSQTMVKNNDPIAVKLFNENGKIPMPDQNFTDAQIKDVLAYIQSLSPAVTPTKATKPTSSATPVVKPAKASATAVVTTKAVQDDWVDADFRLKSYPVDGEIDPKKLHSGIWKEIAGIKIPLSAQNITYPNLKETSIDSIHVKSLYAKNQIAFWVEWKDVSKDTDVDADRFCDQFAVELPLNKNNIPSYMMGNKGGMVHIVHWKAIWQEDCEKGFQDVQMKYPNMWVDVYPGLEGDLDKSKRIYAKDITAEHIVETRSYGNMPGTYSNNPMSQIKRKEPAEEASAEGFGTLATQETQQAKAWAEWKDGKWIVCLVVPVNTGNIYKANVTDKTKVAFALWDGNHQNIGGRKHFIPWVDLLLEKIQ